MTQTDPTQDAPVTPPRIRPAPTPQPRAIVCPYCGVISSNTTKCESCSGRFDPLSRQATQNAMGPWQVRDENNPTLPGCSYDTLVSRIELGKVTGESVVRGPTTRQFWMLAKRVPGVSHLLGFCHACQTKVTPEQYACTSCGAVFQVDRDRQHLGLGPARILPGQGSPERIAAFSQASHASVESPSWAWKPGEAPPAQDSDAGIAASPSTTVAAAGTDIRHKRLERTIVRQRMTVRTLIGVCVVLVAALFVVSAMSRFSGRATPSEREPGLAAAEETRQDAAPTPQLPIDDSALSSVETGDGESESDWLTVRARVMTHLSRGSSESLNAGVLELEALHRRGTLPDEGVELLERLRTEIENSRLGNIP